MTPYEMGIFATKNEADLDYTMRELLTAWGRWRDLGDDEFVALIAEPPMASDRWNALIEGMTAYACSLRRLRAPEWTRRTELEENFNPYDEINQSPDMEFLADVFNTPAELLNKAVVLSRKAFDVL